MKTQPLFNANGVQIFNGDCREVLRQLEPGSINCCVTSPPYFGLRDYGCDGQIGLEQTPDEYVAELVGVFRLVRDAMKDDGVLWLNLGDSYANDGKWGGQTGGKHARALHGGATANGRNKKYTGYKPKDLMGMPWQVAFALREDGWYLRQDIIWAKPNPMPESVADRCTKSHEYIFLLSKSQRYHCDMAAIAEPAVSDHDSGNSFLGRQGGADHLPMNGGAGNAAEWKRWQRKPAGWDTGEGSHGDFHRAGRAMEVEYTETESTTRNKRSVWTIPTFAMPEAHFATFPPKLIEPCIIAGCPAAGTVLDPFGGACTTGFVCIEQRVKCILIELNAEYCEIGARRMSQGVMFTEATA